MKCDSPLTENKSKKLSSTFLQFSSIARLVINPTHVKSHKVHLEDNDESLLYTSP